MSFKNLEQIVEARTLKDANTLLDIGWTLLNIIGDKDGPVYIFGRDKGSPALEVIKRRTLAEII